MLDGTPTLPLVGEPPLVTGVLPVPEVAGVGTPLVLELEVPGAGELLVVEGGAGA